jgi:hypothetical protein
LYTSQGALEPKHGSEARKKRRHTTSDDAPVDGVVDVVAAGGTDMTGGAEPSKGAGRWGHDKFEEEYGEGRPSKGSRKRNL